MLCRLDQAYRSKLFHHRCISSRRYKRDQTTKGNQASIPILSHRDIKGRLRFRGPHSRSIHQGVFGKPNSRFDRAQRTRHAGRKPRHGGRRQIFALPSSHFNERRLGRDLQNSREHRRSILSRPKSVLSKSNDETPKNNPQVILYFLKLMPNSANTSSLCWPSVGGD